MHFCRLLEIIVLGSPDTRIRQFRMTFKLPCGTLTSQIYYQKVVNYLRKASSEMSKLQPERHLGCCTLQLDFPRRSGTYSDLIFNRIVVQSTLLHFSSESGPSGNSRDFQISRKLCRLLQGIGEDTPGNSRHQNLSFQIDHRASMSQLGASR